jgi:Icc-related predicted phosphoesterase
MTIVCISDSHNGHEALEVPEGDVLVHAGDFTNMGEADEIFRFNEWLGTLPHRRKVVVAGNHDWMFELQNERARRMLTNATDYLEDSGVEIEGLLFHGSPVSPTFYDWAFNRNRGKDIDRHWQMIPDDVDVLITHGPPFGIGDRSSRGEHAGCADLRRRIEGLPNLRLMITGHIHEGHGIRSLHTRYREITVVNAALSDLRNRIVRQPLVVTL